MIDLPENTADMREEYLDELEGLASAPGAAFSGRVVVRLIKQIRAEWEDMHSICSEVSQVYSHVTGYRVSKPNTLARDVIHEADSHIESIVEDAKSDFRIEMEAGDE